MTRVLIVGAGVIGQVYAGRLAEAGHSVDVLARGSTAARLQREGIRLSTDGSEVTARVRVLTALDVERSWDVALVAVRRDQVADALATLGELRARVVVPMLNQPVDPGLAMRALGPDRTVLGFPGVGGRVTDDGSVAYVEVRQQPTTVQAALPGTADVVDLLRSTRLRVATCGDMPAWLATHAVFVTCVAGAVLGHGGDARALAADGQAMRSLVLGTREGFAALAGTGVAVTPTPLRVIFTRVPVPFAVWYWRRQLAGPMGTLAIAPHVRATVSSELPTLVADVRRLLHGATPHRLEALLASVERAGSSGTR